MPLCLADDAVSCVSKSGLFNSPALLSGEENPGQRVASLTRLPFAIFAHVSRRKKNAMANKNAPTRLFSVPK
jgi:hypothetical protein